MHPENYIRLRHLKTFLAVAHHQTMSKAANILAITQPAVSKTIGELETILNAQLFDRQYRTLYLTAQGKRFLTRVENSMITLRQAIDEISVFPAIQKSPLHIGALPTVSARLLPKTIQNYHTRNKNNHPIILTGPNHYLIKELREGRLDMVIGRMGEPAEMTDLYFEHLYSEPICFAVRPGHPLVEDQNFTLSAMSQFDFLMPSQNALIRPAVERLMVSAGISEFHIAAETVSTAFCRSYVLSSNAIWVISEGVVLGDIHSKTLISLPVNTSDTVGPVGMTLRANFIRSPDLEMIMHEIRLEAKKIS